ncbi:MAG TPA: hypothetical protein ENJ41_06830, partial [Oceanospirillales bacterium]|nr:hypothetical protein [Oceanospirillales bacterium]
MKPTNKYPYFIITVFLTLCLTSCSKELKPDLARLYNTNYISYDRTPPVILIHGIMGSKLRDKNNLKEKWFGSLKNLIFSNYVDVGLKINPETLEPIDTNLEPFDIADKAAGTDYYNAIIQTLQNYGGYTLTPV